MQKVIVFLLWSIAISTYSTSFLGNLSVHIRSISLQIFMGVVRENSWAFFNKFMRNFLLQGA